MKPLKIIAAVVLAAHGLLHLIGTAAYLKLADVQGFPYKTTVLGGRAVGSSSHWLCAGSDCFFDEPDLVAICAFVGDAAFTGSYSIRLE
jgi:hypothetical protein